MSKIDKNDVKKIVESEVKQLGKFLNYHGITLENLHHFLVDPFEIYVDPDDLETSPRNMWVVLQEYENIKKGYSIVYDPFTNSWGVAEYICENNYVLVICADNLQEALEGM